MEAPVNKMYNYMKNSYYQHYKGGIYQVTDVATHTEQEYPLVIYKSINDDNMLWARPLDMFESYVLIEREDGTKYHEERFKKVIVGVKEVKHPAKYTDIFIPKFADILIKNGCENVFDPFAGTCKISEIKQHGFRGEVFANELEPEWGLLGLSKVDCLNIGDAENLPFKDFMFDAICTSPTYGNRMADSHNAKDGSKRITYTHTLGRKLSKGNTGAMQWGSKYKQKHIAIYVELKRVLKEGGIFILNVSDHIRKGEIAKVTDWHVSTLESIGFVVVDRIDVKTPRNGFGANAKLRVGHESIIVLKHVNVDVKEVILDGSK